MTTASWSAPSVDDYGQAFNSYARINNEPFRVIKGECKTGKSRYCNYRTGAITISAVGDPSGSKIKVLMLKGVDSNKLTIELYRNYVARFSNNALDAASDGVEDTRIIGDALEKFLDKGWADLESKNWSVSLHNLRDYGLSIWIMSR